MPARATFANTVVSRGYTFPFGPGTQPSTCTISTIYPSTPIPQTGTLTLYDDAGNSLALRDCVLETPLLNADMSGQTVTLPIKDRRWRWQLGEITGHYNEPKADGTYRRPKSPQELAAMLFSAMGETATGVANPYAPTTADVSQLPNDERPEKQWSASNPAAELEALCADLGCIVVFDPITDRAKIWKVGTGGGLPGGGALGRVSAPAIPARPQYVRAVGGPSQYQATFPCEAVGLDVDGKWKLLDDLSFRKPWGWTAAPWSGYPWYFEDIDTYQSHGRTLQIRDLAEAHIYRAYRLKGIPGWFLGVVPPDMQLPFAPESFKDYRFTNELLDEEITTGDGPSQGGLIPLPSRVIARWLRIDHKPQPTRPTLYPDAFSFDTQNWIVHFGEPLVLPVGQDGVGPAEVYLETSFSCAGENGAMDRAFARAAVPFAPLNTPDMILQRPEIAKRVIYRFDDTGHQVAAETNEADVTSKLTAIAAQAATWFDKQDGGTVTVPGLRHWTLDGVVQQITWQADKSGCTTTVSAAHRHNRYVKPPAEYRERLEIKRATDTLARLALNQAVRAIGGGL